MLVELPISPRQQLTLWEPACEERCPVWNPCGGSDTAPCSCVWSTPERRHRCETCHLVCRERNYQGSTFSEYVRATRRLDDLSLVQGDLIASLPVFIPLRTNELPSSVKLPLAWGGADLKTLLTLRQGGQARPRSLLDPTASTHESLRVHEGAELLAILNGRDDLLEGFWQMPRLDLYRQLMECGLGAATGPTFSVTVPEGTEMPASHNVLMQLRHHQVVHELAAGAADGRSSEPIPNIYWRDRADAARWVKWLRDHPEVHVVSRDFSRTKQGGPFKRALRALVAMLAAVERPLHVVVAGVGIRKGAYVLRKLAGAGITCTVVSSNPVLEGIKHGKSVYVDGEGDLRVRKEEDRSRSQLAYQNVLVVDRYLSEIATGLMCYEGRPLRNVSPM